MDENSLSRESHQILGIEPQYLLGIRLQYVWKLRRYLEFVPVHRKAQPLGTCGGWLLTKGGFGMRFGREQSQASQDQHTTSRRMNDAGASQDSQFELCPRFAPRAQPHVLRTVDVSRPLGTYLHRNDFYIRHEKNTTYLTVRVYSNITFKYTL
jgi:hypothetical protein